MNLKTEIAKLIPDNLYLKIKYKRLMGKTLNLKNPQTFNEKLQWLKLYDRNPMHTMMVDKYEVKKYVADLIGEEYVIPTLGVWDHFDEIAFEQLPNQFVLKCTHDSGGLVICRDKSALDLQQARDKIESCLKRNFYYMGREWPYKNVKPRIIAERYMEESNMLELRDYKFFCFHGKVTLVLVCSERTSLDGLKETFFDINWSRLNLKRKNVFASTKEIEPPQNLNKMQDIAEKLSNKIIFARIDFYEVEKSLYFGELTFFPTSGFIPFEPDEWNCKLGKMIKLPTDE